MAEEVSITTLISNLRRRINDPRKQSLIFQNKHDWLRLCAAMDATQDTEDIISAYERHEPGNTTSERYLLLYGLLQALFVQQDAMESIAIALKVQYEEDLDLKQIRTIRNESIGHPTDVGYKNNKSYCQIIQMSVTKDYFEYYKSTPSNGTAGFHKVQIPALIVKQRSKAKVILSQFIDELDREDMEHKSKFKTDKFIDLFPPTIGYYFEKVIIGARSDDYQFEIGKGTLVCLKEIVANFKSGLVERGEFQEGSYLTYLFDKVEYPLDELEKYFSESSAARLNKKDACIFGEYLQNQFEKLKEVAVEYDERYLVAI